MQISCSLSGIYVFRDPKMYWVRVLGWKLYYGVEYRCECKDEVGFPPCTECGAGT